MQTDLMCLFITITLDFIFTKNDNIKTSIMSVLAIEADLLQHIQDLFISQLPDKECVASSDPLKYALENGVTVLEFTRESQVSNRGYKQCLFDYTYTLLMKYNDNYYIGTIKSRYCSRSCEGCDAVMYANSGSYQRSNKKVDPREYMTGRIRKLKFHTLEQTSPSS